MCNNGSQQKEAVKLAGNEKSGNVIPFSMSESELLKKIDKFREEYGTGKHGMVTWERFCAYLGYSVEEVRECYQRGKMKGSAYGGRSRALGKMQTEVLAMMAETCGSKLALCNKLMVRDMLAVPPEEVEGGKTFSISFGGGDARSKDARA